MKGMTSETTNRSTLRRRLGACAAPLRRLAVEQAGATLMFVAFAMPMMLGFAALGLDVTMWYLDKRQNQTLADNIALAATMEVNRDSNVTDVTLETLAHEEAERVGFDEDGTIRNIAVNRPPLNGPNAGDDTFIEVIVSEQQDLFMASLALGAPVTVEGRAVGSVTSAGSHCILALDPDMDGALEFSGTATADIGCGVASNSSSDQAILIQGSASLTANPAQAFGDIYESGSATLNTSTPPQPLSERLEDPYAATDVSSYADASCTGGPGVRVNTGVDHFLSPGTFCGGLTVTNGATFFDPGVYVIDSGDLRITTSGAVQVRNPQAGEGVTFVLTATDASDIGTVTITGSGNIDLFGPTGGGHFPGNASDPDHGAFAGMLIFQDSRASCCLGGGGTLKKNILTGGTSMELNGALYFPNQELVYAGGAANNNACIQLVASKVTISGVANIVNNPADCAAAGVETIAQTRVRLTE